MPECREANIFSTAFKLVPKPYQSTFICGCGHTGTTLLARILSTHPDIFSVPFETGAFLGGKGPRWAAFSLFTHAALSRRKILVEKTPRHIQEIDNIRRNVPRAKFVVATRDGRDVVASLGKRYKHFGKAFARWQHDTELSVQALKLDQTMRWKYEDLIDNPVQSLTSLCDFMEITYTENLLDYYKKPIDWGPRARKGLQQRELRNSQVNRPIVDRRGIWKDELPRAVQAWFEDPQIRCLMNDIGY